MCCVWFKTKFVESNSIITCSAFPSFSFHWVDQSRFIWYSQCWREKVSKENTAKKKEEKEINQFIQQDPFVFLIISGWSRHQGISLTFFEQDKKNTDTGQSLSWARWVTLSKNNCYCTHSCCTQRSFYFIIQKSFLMWQIESWVSTLLMNIRI